MLWQRKFWRLVVLSYSFFSHPFQINDEWRDFIRDVFAIFSLKLRKKQILFTSFILNCKKKTPKEVTHAENYEMIVILNLRLNFKWPCGLKKSVFTLKFWKVEKKLWINFAWTLHLTEFNLTLIFSKGQQQLMTSYFWKRVFK